MGFRVAISLNVVDIFQPISTRSRWGTWMHNAHGCISGLILHGAFQTKFLGILYHKLSTFMVIRRGTGSFKCYFRIFEILENFSSWLGAILWYYGQDMHLNFCVISWTFLLDFLTEEGSYQGLKDATSFGLLSDKSTEILGLKYLNFRQILHTGQFGHFEPSWAWLKLCFHMQINQWWCHFWSEKLCVEGQAASMENFQFFEYLYLNYSALLADQIKNKVASCRYW